MVSNTRSHHYYPHQRRSRSSIKHFQSYRFLDMPPELRLKIYELVVGVSQRIYIGSDLDNINNIMPSTIIPCSDHSPAGCLPKTTPDPPSKYRQTHCQYTVSFFRMLRASYEASHANRQSTIISYDMQTGKQQITTKKLTSDNQSALCQDRDTCAGRAQDLRLFRTCRQIYDEARSVLYRSNTFTFFGFATFAAYFGLVTPNQVYMPRCTEPNRLRAIQSMTKVELHGQLGGKDFLDFLSASRLIRMGLGCLTSLASLELDLKLMDDRNVIPQWGIDDCMFSKPESLRRLVVDVESTIPRRQVWNVASERPATEKDKLKVAEGLMRRILKHEGFCDTTEHFLSYDRFAGEEMDPFLT